MATIDAPSVGETDTVAGLWVDLARDQRAYGSHLLPDENRRAIREAVARHIVTGGLLVARADDTVVGFVMFGPEGGSYEQDVSKGVIQNIYVAPEYRGEGIGTALLDAAETRLHDQGLTTFSLDVMADNEQARRFYERHGYEPHRLTLEKDESHTHLSDEA